MTDALLEELVAAVDGPRLMRHMDVFAKWTKVAGTPEELESLRHCEAEMRAYGYETGIITHDAYISVPQPGAQVVVGGSRYRAITHSFSRPAPTGGLTGQLVDLGDGSPDAFAEADVRGKVVLIDGIANPGASLRASRAGAIGQLHVSPHEHLHEMCISPVWGSPSADKLADLPSTVVVTVDRDGGQAIRAALVRDRAQTVTLHAEVDTGWRPTPILVADMAGPDGGTDEPFVFFTGHHDTWYYGVMDNGGANATMLEVSRLAALHRERWRRGLRVAFWSGHSQGRYSSSSWYADHHWEEIERRALVHVNVDSTGGRGNTVVGDTTAAAELRHLAAEALSARAGQTFNNRRMGRAGDQSFWGIGVPALFANMSEQPATGEANASAAVFGGGNRVGHGTGWWWHTPDDLLDKIDEAILVRDTQIYVHAVWRLLAEPVLPLDYAEHARYLQAELRDLQAVVGAGFDLGELIERAGRLEVLAKRLADASRKAQSPADVTRINACLQAVSRALVPVDYTNCDPFDHDPALAQGPYPCLQPLRRLAELERGSDAFKFLATGIQRGRNRVAVALARANRAIEACLAS